MTTRFAFNRVLVGLHQSAPDRAAVRTAAEFAGLMHLDLFGLFIEDPGMVGFAARPGAREFQLLGRRWQAIDPQSLSREIELCASSTRRLLAETAKRLGVPTYFEVIRARIGEAIGAVSRSTDIIIIAEPRSPAERAIAPFPQLVKAAFESTVAVLFAPRRIARTHGPVVVIALSTDDPGIGIGASIAAVAKENLIVIEAFERPAGEAAALPDLASAGGVSVGRLTVARRALLDVGSLSSAIEGLHERIIVTTRGAFGEGDGMRPAELASLRGVPVLVGKPATDMPSDDGRATATSD